MSPLSMPLNNGVFTGLSPQRSNIVHLPILGSRCQLVTVVCFQNRGLTRAFCGDDTIVALDARSPRLSVAGCARRQVNLTSRPCARPRFEVTSYFFGEKMDGFAGI